MRKPIQSLLLLLVFAASCGDPAAKTAPKPIATHVSTRPSAPPEPLPAPPAAKPEPVLHTIEEGQTLWDIARVYGVTLRQLMDGNGMKPADVKRLRTGSQLKIDRPEQLAAAPKVLPEISDGAYHILSEGESLWTLARLYDVPIEAIMTRNGFTEDVYGHLRAGQPIIIPASRRAASSSPIRAPCGVTV